MAPRSPLGDSPLLGLLPTRLQDELVAAGSPLRVSAREWLFREGDPGDCPYLVVSGRMRVIVERKARRASERQGAQPFVDGR